MCARCVPREWCARRERVCERHACGQRELPYKVVVSKLPIGLDMDLWQTLGASRAGFKSIQWLNMVSVSMPPAGLDKDIWHPSAFRGRIDFVSN